MTKTRKEKVHTAAHKLFASKGFAATGMRDIALELKMEAASLYSHIDSKDEILETVCFEMADKFISSLDEVNDIYFNGEEKLRSIIQLHVKIICENINATAIFQNEWRHLSKSSLKKFNMLRKRYEQGFADILKTGYEENIFGDVDIKYAVLSILSILNWVYQWYDKRGKDSPENIAEQLSNFILTGLKK